MESKQLEDLLKSIEGKEDPSEKQEEGSGYKKEYHKYDPAKKYRWEPTTVFPLSGEEFGVILNSLRAILNSPDSQRILLANKANEAIENALSKAVQAGLVKEDVKK